MSTWVKGPYPLFDCQQPSAYHKWYFEKAKVAENWGLAQPQQNKEPKGEPRLSGFTNKRKWNSSIWGSECSLFEYKTNIIWWVKGINHNMRVSSFFLLTGNFQGFPPHVALFSNNRIILCTDSFPPPAWSCFYFSVTMVTLHPNYTLLKGRWNSSTVPSVSVK